MLKLVEINLLEARRAEKDFLLRRKDDYVQKNDSAASAASRDLKTSCGPILRAESRAVADKIILLVADYVTRFAAVVQAEHKVGLDENSGLQGSLPVVASEVKA